MDCTDWRIRRRSKRWKSEIVWTCADQPCMRCWEKDADYGAARKRRERLKREFYGCYKEGHEEVGMTKEDAEDKGEMEIRIV